MGRKMVKPKKPKISLVIEHEDGSEEIVDTIDENHHFYPYMEKGGGLSFRFFFLSQINEAIIEETTTLPIEKKACITASLKNARNSYRFFIESSRSGVILKNQMSKILIAYEEAISEILHENEARYAGLITAHEKRCNSLREFNELKASAIEAAKVYAKSKWESDKKNEIRISKMAEDAYQWLSTIKAYEKALPDTPATLKDWIREIAPSYALQGGRPKKRNK